MCMCIVRDHEQSNITWQSTARIDTSWNFPTHKTPSWYLNTATFPVDSTDGQYTQSRSGTMWQLYPGLQLGIESGFNQMHGQHTKAGNKWSFSLVLAGMNYPPCGHVHYTQIGSFWVKYTWFSLVLKCCQDWSLDFLLVSSVKTKLTPCKYINVSVLYIEYMLHVISH